MQLFRDRDADAICTCTTMAVAQQGCSCSKRGFCHSLPSAGAGAGIPPLLTVEGRYRGIKYRKRQGSNVYQNVRRQCHPQKKVDPQTEIANSLIGIHNVAMVQAIDKDSCYSIISPTVMAKVPM